MKHILGRVMRRSLLLVAPFTRSEIPVLTYHSIDGSRSPISVTPDEFRTQLASLRDGGWRGLSMDEYVATAGIVHPQPRTLLITFDDGYRNFVEYAVPLLREYGFPATMFVPVDYVGRRPTWLERDCRLTLDLLDHVRFADDDRRALARCTEMLLRDELLGWDDLRALLAENIDVQSHSAGHHFMTQLTPDEATDDLRRSRIEIERQLGVSVSAVAYPYGDANEKVGRSATEAGFKVGFVSDHGPRDEMRMMSWRGGVSGKTAPVELSSMLRSWPLYPRLRYFLRRTQRAA